ncbi:MAG: hypothetical protein JXJ22_14835 [Bacteroidales bacterium]|nr:hypothetical protein [Bacteroidales bacterium]
MKKFNLIIAILFCSCYFLFSQSPLHHEKKIYRGTDDKLYINKDLPLYLRLSISPESNSESYLLKSDSSVKYTNPMYLDTEGRNTIRSPWAVDTNTKKTVYPLQDIVFEVYADGLPPVSDLKPGDAKKYINGGKTYYSDQLVLDFSAKDGMSGVQGKYMAINKEDFKSFNENVKLEKEGEYTIHYYAVDNVGNVEKINTLGFFIDKTPPVTKYEIDGILNEHFVSPNATIKLNSTDSLSGISKIKYAINDGPEMLYTTGIPVKNLGSDQGILTFYAIDNCGNIEEKKRIGGDNSKMIINDDEGQNLVFKFYIDDEPPTVSLTLENDLYEKKYIYISSRSKLVLNAEDDKSGVDKIFYAINNKLTFSNYNEPFSLDKRGLQTIFFKAQDFVENVSPIQNKIFYLDNISPKSVLTFEGNKYNLRDTVFITKNTRIKLSATDMESGLKEIMYSLNSEEFQQYKDPFVLEKDGFYHVNFYASDNVNNLENKASGEIFVDNKPPEILYHYSVSSIGSKIVRDEEYTIYSSNTQIYLAATDKGAGGERIEYYINGGAKKTENPVKGLAPGNYEIKIDAFDVLQNKASSVIKFSIEK